MRFVARIGSSEAVLRAPRVSAVKPAMPRIAIQSRDALTHVRGMFEYVSHKRKSKSVHQKPL